MEDGREVRTFVVPELRVDERDDGPVLIGYAAVFGQWSNDLGGFRELVEPGAFAKTIGEADVRALWQHDPKYVLGRSRSGTLKLMEDEIGLRYEVVPPDAAWARDALATMHRGDVDQSSFSFEAVRDVWGEDEDQIIRRRLIEVKLFDVSPVTFPAYPQTSAHVRAMLNEMTSAPTQGGHPDDDDDAASARARLALRRRRLDLIDFTAFTGR